MKRIALALTLALPLAAHAYNPPLPTYNGKIERHITIDVDPRAGEVTFINSTTKSINLQKMVLIEEGSRRCTTPNKPVIVKPGKEVILTEGECGLWSTSEIIFATPKGLIKQKM